MRELIQHIKATEFSSNKTSNFGVWSDCSESWPLLGSVDALV